MQLEPKPGRSFHPHTKDFGVGVNIERAVALAMALAIGGQTIALWLIGSQTTALWPVRLIPDAILKRNNDKYEVMLNDWELPSLNLNPKYKGMLKQKDITEDTKEYLEGRLKAARTLINAINKRKETLQKVTEAIVYVQRDFLNNGMLNLKPMTLSQIANMAGKHKSTVSRTVANKYLQTPDGIFELRQFLNSGVK